MRTCCTSVQCVANAKLLTLHLLDMSECLRFVFIRGEHAMLKFLFMCQPVEPYTSHTKSSMDLVTCFTDDELGNVGKTAPLSNTRGWHLDMAGASLATLLVLVGCQFRPLSTES